MSKILTTENLANIYSYCDMVIKQKIGVDIISLFEVMPNEPRENITRYIMHHLAGDKRTSDLINEYGVANILADFINSMGEKKIYRITNNALHNSNKRPYQMPIPTDEQQLRRIFAALRHNRDLYDKLYKDKIWIMESATLDGSLGRMAKLAISPTQFFHLMGFDYKQDLNPRKHPDGATQFVAPLRNSSLAMRLLENPNNKNYFLLLEELIESENNIIAAAMNGELTQVINFDKLEMKSYAFERMNVLEHSSGMIFFDKNLARSLGHEKLDYIGGDIILLNDFIRKYDLEKKYGLDFVFSPYKKVEYPQIADQESIVISSAVDGGKNSGFLDQQKSSISSRVGSFSKKDFEHTIRLENSEEVPISSPADYIEFTDEDKALMAATIIEGLPNLNNLELLELYNQFKNNYNNSKKKH